MQSIHVVSRPASEPVSLDEARLHLRLDTSGSPPEHPDDSLVEALIGAARESAENFLNARIAEWGLELRLTNFAERIPLSDGPVQSIESVTYIDEDGVTQTVDSSTYELAGSPDDAVLRPVYGESWPTDVRTQDDAVRIRYTAGYSTGSPYTLPAPVRAAILLMLGNLYENREANVIGAIVEELPLGVAYLLQPYRRQMGV